MSICRVRIPALIARLSFDSLIEIEFLFPVFPTDSSMRGLIMPILIVAAIGIPIWIVYNSRNRQPVPGYDSYSQNGYANNGYYGANDGYTGTPTGSGFTGTGGSGFLNAGYGRETTITALPPSNVSPIYSNPAATEFSSAPPAGSIIVHEGMGSGTVITGQPGMPQVIGNIPGYSGVVPQGNGPVIVQSGFPGHAVPATVGGPAFISGPPTQLAGTAPIGPATGRTVVFRGNEFGPNTGSVPLEFLPTTDLSEVFRFDIDPNWVRQRWDRVSTSPGEPGLNGLRVPLVTGTNRNDLHGSLTYYFDSNQNPQRITFRGWTGDSSGLVNLLTTRYGFQKRSTDKAGLYTVDDGNSLVGAMMLRHPPVISSRNVSQQENIEFELNNPAGQYPLSHAFHSLLGR